MEYKDYYQILSVSRDAPQSEIKKQYRRLARKYHPDVSKEADAELRFKELGEAYEVLKDPEKRQAYDQLGENWKAGEQFRPPPGWEQHFGGGFGGGQAGGAGFSDFFEQIFGGAGQGGFNAQGGFGGQGGHAGFGGGFHHQPPQKGADLQLRIKVRLQEAFEGVERTIHIPEGRGHRKLKVRIPKGIQAGKKIRLSGQGKNGPAGRGDLLLEVQFEDDPRFSVDEKDGQKILLNLPIAPWEAALGAQVTVPTLGGDVGLKIPSGAKSGQKMRLKGRGLPGKTDGDQIVTLQIQTPTAETDEEKAFYEKMQEQFATFDPREV